MVDGFTVKAAPSTTNTSLHAAPPTLFFHLWTSQARDRKACALCQAVNGSVPADGTGCDGHGTHVASIVGGAKYGVAKEVTIVPVFACGLMLCENGEYDCLSDTDIRATLEWALKDCSDHPNARCVVQRSIGGGYLTEDAALLNANVRTACLRMLDTTS